MEDHSREDFATKHSDTRVKNEISSRRAGSKKSEKQKNGTERGKEKKRCFSLK